MLRKRGSERGPTTREERSQCRKRECGRCTGGVCVCAPEERKEEETRAGKYGTLVLTHAEPVGICWTQNERATERREGPESEVRAAAKQGGQ